MDIFELRENVKICDEAISLAKQYAEARKIAGKAESELKIILASELKNILSRKPNVGIEMAIEMLLETDVIYRDIYKEWKENEGLYKGLKKLIDVLQSKISYSQSIIKYERDNT